MKEKMMNLREKIYLLTYAKPRYIGEISKMFYGKEECKQINREIKTLVEGKKWIKKVSMNHDLKDDQRVLQRKYYSANSKILYDIIVEKLKKVDIILEKEERYVPFFKKEMNEGDRLKVFLDQIFRSKVNLLLTYIDRKAPYFGINTILEELSLDCEYIITNKRFTERTYRQIIGSSIETKSYEEWKKQWYENHLSKTNKDSKTKTPNENAELYLDYPLMEKLTNLSRKSISRKSRIWTAKMNTYEELLLLMKYREEGHKISFSIEPHFKETYERYID